jgi:VIT1/CCC1 family predicted Fe2+/Mn2+ transporter
MNKLTIVEIIQLMLAPGIMISACGLLILGINNKYSLVVNRIRLLNEERRRILSKLGDKAANLDENVRLESISKQITALRYRVKLVRNSVLCYTIAVALFVITSLLIGIEYYTSSEGLTFLVTTIFLLGMISVLLGVSFGAYETIKGYLIIQLEVKIDE